MPKDVSHIRSFLGLANYFRRFIQGYATMVTPLTNLTRKDVPFEWTAECQTAFDAVKHALTTAPVLAVPDENVRYEVVCDASNFGLGAALLQNGRPVAFESRKLSPAERNYHATDREMLAVINALRVWRCYLHGLLDFTAVTDHAALTRLQRPKRFRRGKYGGSFIWNNSDLPGFTAVGV